MLSPTRSAHREGLSVGVVSTAVDPLCEDLGHVVAQNPAAGIVLPLGSPVDFKYAVAPSNGCGTPQ